MHCIVSAIYWIKITSDRKGVFWSFIIIVTTIKDQCFLISMTLLYMYT